MYVGIGWKLRLVKMGKKEKIWENAELFKPEQNTFSLKDIIYN